MKALVTGGTGFIGSRLVSKLIQKGYEVLVLSHDKRLKNAVTRDNLNFYIGDLRKKETLRHLPSHFDFVFHLAAERDSVGKKQCYRINVLGTMNLIETICEAGMKIKKFIHVSSLGAAGFNKNKNLRNEGDLPEPVSFYGKTKLLSEQEIINSKKHFPSIILRPCKIYGPGDKRILLHFKLTKYGMVPDLGLKNRFMSLCYIDDFVEAMILAAESNKENEVYFVSDGNVYSWEKFYGTIAGVLNKSMRTITIPEAILEGLIPLLKLLARLPLRFIPIEPTTLNEIRSKSWTCDSSKFFKEFDFHPKIKLEEGIGNTAEWFKEHKLI